MLASIDPETTVLESLLLDKFFSFSVCAKTCSKVWAWQVNLGMPSKTLSILLYAYKTN
jgi:hypothetical protein